MRHCIQAHGFHANSIHFKFPIIQRRIVIPNKFVNERITEAKREKKKNENNVRGTCKNISKRVSMSLRNDIGSYNRVGTCCQGWKVLSIKYTRKNEP